MPSPMNFIPPMPAGGYGFGALDLPPVIPPDQEAFSPEFPPLVEPIPVEAAFEPAPMVPMTGDVELDFGPAEVKPMAPASLRQDALAARPPVVDMLGAQPAPVSGPDVEIAKGRDQQRNIGQARSAAEQDSAMAAQDYRAAAEAWTASKTPAERAAAEKAAADAQQRMQGAQAVAQAAGLAQEREDAAQEAVVGEAIMSAKNAKLAEVADVLNTRAAETQRKVEEAEQIRVKAAERRAAKEQEYAVLLERGPRDKTATWTSAIGMIGEMFSAYAQKRQPNFEKWMETGLEMAREKHKGELDAIRTRIESDEQAIEDAAVEVATARADDLAFEQSILAKTERDLQVLAAQYAGTPKGAAAEQARQAVAVKQALRANEAALAAEKAQREREKHAAEMRKLSAEASIAERKAARTGMGGTPKPVYGQTTDISPTALVDPITGVVLGESRFQDRGKVREDQDTLRGMSDMISETQEYINMLASVGKVYTGLGAKYVKDADVAKLTAKYNKLLSDTIKAYSGAAASDKEVERLKGILPPPKSYTDMGSWDPADVMRNYRNTHATVYENFLATRLKTGATLIRDSKGKTLPTSPTYGWRAETGAPAVRTMTGDIVVDLNQDSETAFDERLSGWVAEAAGAQPERRKEIADGMKAAAQALKDTRQVGRAKDVREALKLIDEGKTRDTKSGAFPATVGQPEILVQHTSGARIRVPASKAADLDEGWEVVDE